MDSTRRIPLWAWWVIGPAVIIGITAGVVIAVSNPAPILPPGLVEKREAVAKLRDEASRLKDVDIKPLVGLEAKKDYSGAVKLMDEALAANAAYERTIGEQVALGNELARLAIQVEPDAVGAKAITAFETLTQLARAEQKFYDNRRKLYELTRNYYAELLAERSPSVPADLRALVDAVNADFGTAQQLSAQFAAAVRAFDEAVQR